MSIQPNGSIFFKLLPFFVHTIDFLQHFFLFFLFPIAAVVFSTLSTCPTCSIRLFRLPGRIVQKCLEAAEEEQ
jgi:hypothetical protein